MEVEFKLLIGDCILWLRSPLEWRVWLAKKVRICVFRILAVIKVLNVLAHLIHYILLVSWGATTRKQIGMPQMSGAGTSDAVR